MRNVSLRSISLAGRSLRFGGIVNIVGDADFVDEHVVCLLFTRMIVECRDYSFSSPCIIFSCQILLKNDLRVSVLF